MSYETISEEEKKLLVLFGFAFFRLHTALSQVISDCGAQIHRTKDEKHRLIFRSSQYTAEKIDSIMHDLIRIYEIDINKLHELSKKSEIG